MQRADIIIGEEYGLRENRQLGAPLQRIRIVQHVRGTKWRAEWVEPNPGLVDYVDGRTLLVRWSESAAFIADESSERCVREHIRANGYDEESPVAGALYTVFEAAGDKVQFYGGQLNGPPDALVRVRIRASIDPLERTELEYVDRHGIVHVPLAGTIALAQAFCAADAEAVVSYLEVRERSPDSPEFLRTPGAAQFLARQRAACALVLQWCGTGHSALVRRETQRLRQLVLDAAEALQTAGRGDAARALREEVGPVDGDAAGTPTSTQTTAAEPATWAWRGRVRPG